MEELKQRRGMFKITRQLLEECDTQKMLELFGNFIILRAEHMFIDDSIEYQAYSPLFDILPEGAVTPWYTFNVSDEGDITIEQIRR